MSYGVVWWMRDVFNLMGMDMYRCMCISSYSGVLDICHVCAKSLCARDAMVCRVGPRCIVRHKMVKCIVWVLF